MDVDEIQNRRIALSHAVALSQAMGAYEKPAEVIEHAKAYLAFLSGEEASQ